MNFNSIVQGSNIYILYRTEPIRLVTAEVISKSEPRYNVKNNTAPQQMYGQQIAQVVDITVKAGDQVIPFGSLNINDESVSCNNGTMFVATTSEAALTEIRRMMSNSSAELQREAYNKMVLEEGEKICEMLDPKYREDKQQKAEITSLRTRVNGIDDKLDTIMGMLQTLNEPKGSKTKN